MESYNYNRVYSGEQTLQQYMTKVFGVMGSGLAITALVAGLGYYSLITGGIVFQIYARFYTVISLVSLYSLVSVLRLVRVLPQGLLARQECCSMCIPLLQVLHSHFCH